MGDRLVRRCADDLTAALEALKRGRDFKLGQQSIVVAHDSLIYNTSQAVLRYALY